MADPIPTPCRHSDDYLICALCAEAQFEAIRQQERELRAYEWREMEQALRAAEAERDALRKMVK